MSDITPELEAVARAILETDPTCDYDVCREKYAHLPVGHPQRNWWDALHKKARAALLAIRQPTEAMGVAMHANFDPDYPDLYAAHRAMINYIIGGQT